VLVKTKADTNNLPIDHWLADVSTASPATQTCIETEIVPAFATAAYNDNSVRGRLG